MEPALDDAAYWENLAAEQEAGTRDDCVAHFYPRAGQNRRRSEEAGRPVCDEIAYVRIRVPGDRNNVVDRKAHAADRERWAGQWAAFLARRTPRAGTPVEQWPYLSVARVAELRAVGLFTVEQIAGATDALLERIGPDGRALSKRAREHLQPQSETETALRAEIAALQRRAADQAARLTAAEVENARLRNAGRNAPVGRRK